MDTAPRQSIALPLAAVYAFIALLGHALHSHHDCGDTHHAVCEVACDCEHDHQGAAPHSERSSSAGWKSAEPAHDCVACALMAQLSVGYAAAGDATVSQPPAALHRLSIPSAVLDPAIRLADARGPPTAG